VNKLVTNTPSVHETGDMNNSMVCFRSREPLERKMMNIGAWYLALSLIRNPLNRHIALHCIDAIIQFTLSCQWLQTRERHVYFTRSTVTTDLTFVGRDCPITGIRTVDRLNAAAKAPDLTDYFTCTAVVSYSPPYVHLLRQPAKHLTGMEGNA